MAVKPYLGVIKNSVPSDFDNYDLNEPNANLELEFIHGY